MHIQIQMQILHCNADNDKKGLKSEGRTDSQTDRQPSTFHLDVYFLNSICFLFLISLFKKFNFTKLLANPLEVQAGAFTPQLCSISSPHVLFFYVVGFFTCICLKKVICQNIEWIWLTKFIASFLEVQAGSSHHSFALSLPTHPIRPQLYRLFQCLTTLWKSTLFILLIFLFGLYLISFIVPEI